MYFTQPILFNETKLNFSSSPPLSVWLFWDLDEDEDEDEGGLSFDPICPVHWNPPGCTHTHIDPGIHITQARQCKNKITQKCDICDSVTWNAAKVKVPTLKKYTCSHSGKIKSPVSLYPLPHRICPSIADFRAHNDMYQKTEVREGIFLTFQKCSAESASEFPSPSGSCLEETMWKRGGDWFPTWKPVFSRHHRGLRETRCSLHSKTLSNNWYTEQLQRPWGQFEDLSIKNTRIMSQHTHTIMSQVKCQRLPRIYVVLMPDSQNASSRYNIHLL